jgi:tetratricopeptide (TPR) repeat protein
MAKGTIPATGVAQSAADFTQQGWLYYGEGEAGAAEQSFRTAISLSPGLIDAYYGLGLALKVQGVKPEAIQAFTKVVELLNREVANEPTRNQMLRRLAKGQINLLQSGDWGLEKEIWKRSK